MIRRAAEGRTSISCPLIESTCFQKVSKDFQPRNEGIGRGGETRREEKGAEEEWWKWKVRPYEYVVHCGALKQIRSWTSSPCTDSIILKVSLGHSSLVDNAQNCYSSSILQTILKITPLGRSKETLFTVRNPFRPRPQDAFRTPQARDGLLPGDDFGSAVQVGRVPESALDRVVLAGRAHDRAR